MAVPQPFNMVIRPMKNRPFLTVPERILQLIDEHGSERAVGRALGIDNAHLNRLRHCVQTHPCDDTLRKLGLLPARYYELAGNKVPLGARTATLVEPEDRNNTRAAP
jgi:hypothetical protein